MLRVLRVWVEKKGWKGTGGERDLRDVRPVASWGWWHRFTCGFFLIETLLTYVLLIAIWAPALRPPAISVLWAGCLLSSSPLSLRASKHVDVQIDGVRCAGGGDDPERGRFRCVRRAVRVRELQDRCSREQQHPSRRQDEQLPLDGRGRGHD